MGIDKGMMTSTVFKNIWIRPLVQGLIDTCKNKEFLRLNIIFLRKSHKVLSTSAEFMILTNASSLTPKDPGGGAQIARATVKHYFHLFIGNFSGVSMSDFYWSGLPVNLAPCLGS